MKCKFTGTQPCSSALSKAALVLQRQGDQLRQTAWLTKLEMCTVGPFIEKVCHPLV